MSCLDGIGRAGLTLRAAVDRPNRSSGIAASAIQIDLVQAVREAGRAGHRRFSFLYRARQTSAGWLRLADAVITVPADV